MTWSSWPAAARAWRTLPLRHEGCTLNAHVITADLARPEAPDQIRAELQAASISVDILVNNAGFAMYGPFIDANPQTEAEMIPVNMLGPHPQSVLIGWLHARPADGRLLRDQGVRAVVQLGPGG